MDMFGLYGTYLFQSILALFVYAPALIAGYVISEVRLEYIMAGAVLDTAERDLTRFYFIHGSISAGIGLVGGIISGLFCKCFQHYHNK